MLERVIATLICLFLVVGVFIGGSTFANGLINGEDPMFTLVGFGVYLMVGIIEILLGYVLTKLWSRKS